MSIFLFDEQRVNPFPVDKRLMRYTIRYISSLVSEAFGTCQLSDAMEGIFGRHSIVGHRI